MVDIFQVVKAQRMQKPGLVLTAVSNNYTVTLIMLIINNYSFFIRSSFSPSLYIYTQEQYQFVFEVVFTYLESFVMCSS